MLLGGLRYNILTFIGLIIEGHMVETQHLAVVQEIDGAAEV